MTNNSIDTDFILIGYLVVLQDNHVYMSSKDPPDTRPNVMSVRLDKLREDNRVATRSRIDFNSLRVGSDLCFVKTSESSERYLSQ